MAGSSVAGGGDECGVGSVPDRTRMFTHGVMSLVLDSLGQCVSALSKRFAAAETFRDAVNSIPYSHREKRSEIRHRKDQCHHQEDAEGSKVPAKSGRPLSQLGSDAACGFVHNGLFFFCLRTCKKVLP